MYNKLGKKLWKKAKKIIPGGNSFLSKNPNRFLGENKWPNYYSKAKGCYIWDLQNQKYIDMSMMSIGTNLLGYSNKYVDDAVRRSINKSITSTLNCPEEVFLAEKILNLHPWADMVKFARTGGETLSMAVRIARAASAKDKIVICGYHGWHDWYLSANLDNKNNLDTHLFPNLKFSGVPKVLKKTVYTFKYNDFDNLKRIVEKDKEIGIIIMEVERDIPPKFGFLDKVKKLAKKNSIILIFDECTSGFSETFGGIHLKHKVIPDIAMFGKALGNGYAITLIIGKKEIMKYAKNTFISSTFFSERVGPTAGIATLDCMKRTKSWEVISDRGLLIKKELKNIASNYKIDLEITGLKSKINFDFKYNNANFLNKKFTEQMLKRGFLASKQIYISIAHTPEIINKYLDNLDKVFKNISKSL
jgi:glutamate-1-semialdehyde 2,1-aminomutase